MRHIMRGFIRRVETGRYLRQELPTGHPPPYGVQLAVATASDVAGAHRRLAPVPTTGVDPVDLLRRNISSLYKLIKAFKANSNK